MRKKITMMDENLKNNQENVKTVVAKVELVQQQLNKQEECNRQLKADNVEIKKSLSEIMKQLERMMAREVQAEGMKKGIAEGGWMDREPKVVVAGGPGLNSVEMFSLATKTWTPLQPMKVCRQEASSVVYRNQIVVTGGKGKHNVTKSVENLPLNAVLVDHSIPWGKVPVELPGKLVGHCSVVYNGRCIVIEGYDVDKKAFSDSVTEISLGPPYTSKLLSTMPQARCYHSVAIFDDKILIIAGRNPAALRSVVMYDITKNEWQGLAPLPYMVSEMAAVKINDYSVTIMGGVERPGEVLNKVLLYNIKTQKSHELPDMTYKRHGCVAAVVRDTVIVMGGQGERKNVLDTVEGFRFDRNSWEELPPMHEARCWATAVVC